MPNATRAKSDDSDTVKNTEVHQIWKEIHDQRGAVGELKTEIASITTSLGGINRVLIDLDASVKALQSRQLDGNKTNWTTWIAAGTLLLGIVVLWGTGLLNPIDVKLQATQEQVSLLTARELADAETRGEERGRNREKFLTLEAKLEGGITNRKDMDAKQTQRADSIDAKLNASVLSLDNKIDGVKDDMGHMLDNGLGRRIDEKLGPTAVMLDTVHDLVKQHEQRLLKVESTRYTSGQADQRRESVIEAQREFESRISAIEARQERDERRVHNSKIADDEDTGK